MFKPTVSATNTNSNTESNAPKIDYDAQRAHVIERAGTQDKHRTITGFIGGYYSLGKQEQTPYEAIYEESNKDFAQMKENVEKGLAKVEVGNIKIKDTWHNDVQVYKKPRPPREAIALGVFFPQITVDRDQFKEGGESNPRPLMLLMGGETFVPKLDGSGKSEKVIQYPTFIQENTNNLSGQWGLGQTTLLHKMGSALGLLNENNLMKVDKLGELLGQPLQFRMRVYDKPTKKGGTWYTEEVKFVSEVPEGLTIPEFDTSYIHGINFDAPNDMETVKHLRTEIVNTIKRAVNFEGSIIQKELIEAGRIGGEDTTSQQKPQQEAPVSHGEQSSGQGSVVGQVSGGQAASVQRGGSVGVYNETPMDFDDDQ